MKQELRLEQQLLLTPQLLLNLKLLALPTQELQSLIEKELETNPILETAEEPEESFSSPSRFEDKKARLQASESLNTEDYTISDFLPEDLPLRPTEPIESEFDWSESVSPASIDLVSALLPQLAAKLSSTEIPIAQYILQNLDEDGFLLISEEELMNNLKIDKGKLKNVLKVIHELAPGGLATKTPQEALLIQLGLLGYDKTSLEYRIVSEYYEPMGKKQFSLIAKGLRVSEKNIRAALRNIGQLDPRPARRFTQTNPAYISPDFTVEWQEEKLIAYLNDDNLPSLRLSRRYREILSNPKAYPKEEVKFARAKFASALMLIRGLESRKRTLKRVMDYILDQQMEFFRDGKEFLKPASIQDAAKALNIHPSTISRAIAGKYVETPIGIFPLRFFFASGTGSFARHSVKDKIKQIIEGEDKKTPYSDDEIVDQLAKQGIKISRRTVAKYRAEMKIPGCSERKEI